MATDVLTPTAMGTIVSRDVCELGATVAFHGGTAGTASYHVRLVSAASLMLHTAKAVACQQCASSVVTAAAHGLAVNDAVRLDFSGIPAGVREKQTLTCVATSGTFTLSFGGYTTTALQWNANAATVQGAVVGLASVVSATVAFSGVSTVACAAAPGVGIDVTFTGNAGNQAPLTYDISSLQGGVGTIVVVETTTGKSNEYLTAANGLNVVPGQHATHPKLVEHIAADGVTAKLYATWTETDASGKDQLRLSVYNGNDAAPKWTPVLGSLNLQATQSAKNQIGRAHV